MDRFDGIDIESEAARYVWARIPPHLLEIGWRAQRLIDALEALEGLEIKDLNWWLTEIRRIAYGLHAEASTTVAMYSAVGEWIGWGKEPRNDARL